MPNLTLSNCRHFSLQQPLLVSYWHFLYWMFLWLSRNVLYICDELEFVRFKNSQSQYLLYEVYYLWHNNMWIFIIKAFLVFPCVTKIVSSFIVGKQIEGEDLNAMVPKVMN